MARPGCLILHGLGGGAYELGPLIEALRPEVAALDVPTLPGHEGPGPRMPASRWEDWARTAEDAFDRLAEGGGPVAVVGFSTGGTLALWLAARRPVSRMALLAPFLAIRTVPFSPIRPEALLSPVARLLPDLPRRPPAVRDRASRDRLRGVSPFKTFSLGATRSALDLIRRVKPAVPLIRVPALIVQGAKDTVVDPAGATWLDANLGSPEKRLAVMPRSDHLLAWDFDREEVMRAVRGWILA